MGGSIRLIPFDWDRYSKLTAAFAAGRSAEAVALLAAGPAWKNPQAGARLAAFEARGIDLPGFRLELGLAADPARFADEGAAWLFGLSERDRASVLEAAAATAATVEVPISIDQLLGLFDAAWRRGYWPHGQPERSAPEAIELAFGALEPGARLRSPEEVRRAAAALARIEVSKLPLQGGAWKDGVDRDGGLDQLLRESLAEMIAFFAQAAARGWAISAVAG